MSQHRARDLYRRILKAHRKSLPADLRDFGDMYVRNEFNLHKKVTSPERLGQFYVSWEGYLRSLRPHSTQQVADTQVAKFGRDLTDKEKVALNKEQQEKLDDLLRESRNATPPDA
jgi:hypothetical protein|eukprot:gene1713-1235_t